MRTSYGAEDLHDDETMLSREWLVTNGLGSYASSTAAGANTRRYHGLFVPALRPPVGRSVLLSKLEETLELLPQGGSHPDRYPLSANLYPGVISPQGYKQLESFTTDPAPTWTWRIQSGARLRKRIWMHPGDNTIYVSYSLTSAPDNYSASLSLVPLVCWKDYHSEMRAYDVKVDSQWTPAAAAPSDSCAPASLTVGLPGVWGFTDQTVPLVIQATSNEGTPWAASDFTGRPDWYYRFQHPREHERGMEHEEDLYSPGALCLKLAPGETVVVRIGLATAAPATPSLSWDEYERRRAELLERAAVDDGFARDLVLAADQFVVRVPGKRSTIIAGYPWFSDWGRDTMIALPGLTLSTGRPAIAREILLSFAAFVSEGMLPNRFPDVGEEPEYNTVDATLWYFVAIYRYIEATGDMELLTSTLWAVLEDIVAWHLRGTRYNIHVDPADHLLYAGKTGEQLTWMDARVGDWVVTPRMGKPVEINALWINALRTMAYFAARNGDAEATARYEAEAELATASFLARYIRPDGCGLFDVLDPPDNSAPDASIRPNQIFAISLPFAPLAADSQAARDVLAIVESDLLTPVGLRTLSPLDPAYRARYEGDALQRDGAYHQGTVWPWLLGPFAEAHYHVRRDGRAAMELLRPLSDHLQEYGIGSIAEVFDGDAPRRPGGCPAQAWSVSETLRVLKDLLNAPR